METIRRKAIIIQVFVLFFFMLPLSANSAPAVKITFTVVGECIINDYDTPAVAEQRAIYYAKQRAVEQAAIYVDAYIRSEGMQVTEDKVLAVTSIAMNITEQRTSKQPQTNGVTLICAELTVEVDTDDVKKIL